MRFSSSVGTMFTHSFAFVMQKKNGKKRKKVSKAEPYSLYPFFLTLSLSRFFSSSLKCTACALIFAAQNILIKSNFYNVKQRQHTAAFELHKVFFTAIKNGYGGFNWLQRSGCRVSCSTSATNSTSCRSCNPTSLPLMLPKCQQVDDVGVAGMLTAKGRKDARARIGELTKGDPAAGDKGQSICKAVNIWSDQRCLCYADAPVIIAHTRSNCPGCRSSSKHSLFDYLRLLTGR